MRSARDTKHACRQQTLKGLLHDYRLFPGLVVHWILFGSAGRITRPHNGGMMQHYMMCNPEPRETFKTIANMFYADRVDTTPHNLSFRCVACC